MNIVTISPKFQVVIPRAVRERLDLRPRQQVQAFARAIEDVKRKVWPE